MRIPHPPPEATAQGSVTDRGHVLVPVSAEQAWRLLRAMHFGRLAFDGPDGPVIVPVNYVVDGDEVLVRTDVGAKLGAAQERAAAAFEIDHVDPIDGSGWSVVARGHLEVRSVPGQDRAGLTHVPPPLPDGARRHVVALRVAHVEGRRLTRSLAGAVPTPDDAPWFTRRVP